VIRDVAWIADTIAHDNFVRQIFNEGVIEAGPMVCHWCKAPLAGKAKAKAVHQRLRYTRMRVYECRTCTRRRHSLGLSGVQR
jgi:hypothetical protein